MAGHQPLIAETLDKEHWTMVRSGPVDLPFGKPIPPSIRGFMWAVELQLLNQKAHDLLEAGVSGGCLEIGSYAGLSACALGQPGPLTCVDTFTDVWGPSENERYTRHEFDANMKLMGIEPEVYEMNSAEALPLLAREVRKFRLIFIDAGHSYKEAHRDMLLSLPLLSEGGVLAIDDGDMNDVLRAAVDCGLRGERAPTGKLLFARPKEA
jgi:Methyltransferase domain